MRLLRPSRAVVRRSTERSPVKRRSCAPEGGGSGERFENGGGCGELGFCRRWCVPIVCCYPRLARSLLGCACELAERAVEAVSGGDPALTRGAVCFEQRPSGGELVRAVERLGVRLELDQQPGDALPGRLDDSGVRVDERSVEPVAEGAPAVLAQAAAVVGRQPLPAAPTLGERRDQCLADGGDRAAIGDVELRVGGPERERAVLGPRPQIPPQEAEVTRRVARACPDEELGQLAPGDEGGGNPRARQILVNFSRVEASPLSAPSKNGGFAGSATSSGKYERALLCARAL
jgi:hypothetical protein